MNYCFVDRANAHSIWSLIDSIAAELLTQGHSVTYCKFCEFDTITDRYTPPGVKVENIYVPSKNSILGLPKQILIFAYQFNKLIDNFDVLHTNFVLPGAFAKFIARNKITIIVTTQHEIYHSMRFHWRLLLRFANKYTDSTVYISDQVKKSFQSSLGSSSSDKVIKNGIDTKLLFNISNKNPTVKNSIKVICPGRLVPEKGQRVLIEAWPLVLNVFPDATLHFLGEGVDLEYLQNRCMHLGIDNSVNFPGWLEKSETLCMIASSNIVIVPSDGTQEGFGLVVAESMALMAPIICSDIPIFREVAGDTVTYFKVNDALHLSRQIINNLQNNDNNYDQIVRARKRVIREFDQQKMVDQYIKLYKSHFNKVS